MELYSRKINIWLLQRFVLIVLLHCKKAKEKWHGTFPFNSCSTEFVVNVLGKKKMLELYLIRPKVFIIQSARFSPYPRKCFIISLLAARRSCRDWQQSSWSWRLFASATGLCQELLVAFLIPTLLFSLPYRILGVAMYPVEKYSWVLYQQGWWSDSIVANGI